MPLSVNDYNRVQKAASLLISQFNIKEPPVAVLEIVKKLGIGVLEYDLGDSSSASGILVVENGIGTIGYNPNDSKVRQRFTIAHELGHFLLHTKNGSEKEKVFVDKDFLVKYRNKNNYNLVEFRHEQEANTFAAALLMPEELLYKEIEKKIYSDLSENQVITKLAKVFNVSEIAMTYRLTNLNISFN